MHNNDTISSGVKSTLNSNEAFSQTQAAWRFFNNPNCSLYDLAIPLVEAAHNQWDKEIEEYGLCIHDWSNISYTKHNSKKDKYQVFKGCRGYALQTSLLISDRHGGPLAPVAVNIKNKDQLYSSYGSPDRSLTNLEELSERINYIESEFSNKKLVHIVDREGDSVSLFRKLKNKNWLIRVKAGNTARYKGENIKTSAIAETLNYRDSRAVLYKGMAATQKVAYANVEITRKSAPLRKDNKGKRLPKIDGEAVKCLLVVSKVYDKLGNELAVWYLLSNMLDIEPSTLALWYYWRWSIESFFKLLKKAGLNLEQWQQESATAIFRRLLVASMACVFIWRLAHDTRPQAAPVRKLLIRLSGRQMKWGVEFTYNALFAGMWSLLTIQDLFDQYEPEKIKTLITDSLELTGVA